MKAPLVLLSIVLMSTPAFAGFRQYGWTISNSTATAFSNSGPFAPGVNTYYLWLSCCGPSGDDGMSAAGFDLVSSNPANIVLAFTPMNGFLNAGTATSLLLAVGGCPCGPIVAGSILTLDNAPGSFKGAYLE